MLKAILVAESEKAAAKLQDKFTAENGINIVATLMPHEFTEEIPKLYKIDLIMFNGASATMLLQRQIYGARQHVTARTRQGIQLVAIKDVYFFSAEHKYVTAFYIQGQLLIEDSLNSLGQEFAPQFMRIHRKILVARDKIEQLLKDATGQYHVKIKDLGNLLPVSRRQLPHIRQILLHT